jgi:hypothetical protein
MSVATDNQRGPMGHNAQATESCRTVTRRRVDVLEPDPGAGIEEPHTAPLTTHIHCLGARPRISLLRVLRPPPPSPPPGLF